MRMLLPGRLLLAVMLLLPSLLTQSALAVDLPAHFVYRGSLTHFPQNKDDRGQEVKRFQVDAFVEQPTDNEIVMNYVISENGSGGWHWSQQFGSLTFNSAQKAQSGREWMLLTTYEDAEYEVAFRAPWFEKLDRLAVGANWEENPFVYTVKNNADETDDSSWSINMKHNLSRHQDLKVEKATGLVTEARQVIFAGQGERFQLDWKLEEQLPLDGNAWSAVSNAWKGLAGLQKELEVDLYVPVEELSSDQLEITRSQLATLKNDSAGTPFESLVRRIELQTELGEERADSMAALASQYVGKDSPDFKLTGLKDDPIASEDYAGKPVILHFWRYQDQSLKAPYGQIGYLDFLFNRRESEGLKVYGIAVDPRLSNPKTRRSAILQIKKTIRFMNLSYPVTLDGGDLLEKFGNPQMTAGELPLWVVIGPDGKVQHYSTGHFKVQPNEGLKDLDAMVAALLAGKSEEK